MSEWPAPGIDLVQAITDTKLLLGHRYAQWCLAGPSLEDDIGGASAAQEEIGHVRQLVRELHAQGRDEDWLNGDRESVEFNNAASLDNIDGGWTAFVASVAPADRAAWYLLDAIDRDDMDGLITKIGEEEYFHLEYHDARLETLADDEPETLQNTLETTLSQALAFIGPGAHDEDADPLVSTGFTDRPVAEIRRTFADHYRDLFAGTPVSLENVAWDAPDVDEWDETRRRIDGGSISETDVRQLQGVENEMYAMN